MKAKSPEAPLTQLKGVGARMQERLSRLGLERIEDLVFHLPLRYQDRTRLTPLGALRPHTEALVQGRVEYAQVVQRKRRAFLVRIADGTGCLTLRFFYFGAALQNRLSQGQTLRLFGEVRPGPAGLEMVHPEYRLIAASEMPQVPVESALTPVYPSTEGIGQAVLRRLIGHALHEHEIEDIIPLDQLPPTLRYGLKEALELVHAPPPDADITALIEGHHPAQQRLAFEELLAHQLSLMRLRHRLRALQAPAIKNDSTLFRQFISALPFTLTLAQQRVIEEIFRDMARPMPMMRLVQGDVGSGKTIVALAACLHTIASGYQAALMAPTELLAEQHYRNASKWLQPLGVRIAWLSGKQKKSERDKQLAALADGSAQLAIGTHALFQEQVRFHNLALVGIDEQHRFGVHQRLALRDKANVANMQAHQLVMTATPIPRTLAMTTYADLDYSAIDELPAGRRPVTTVAIADDRRSEVIARLRSAIAAGRQAYWVCTLIEESEALQCEAAESTHALLRDALPDVRVGLVHGRMKTADKEAVMHAFKQGDIDLLVATTVVEVGVDVPNASLMIIENAERLGLAQLHQLRGRVGRGTTDSSCVLLYRPPLGEIAKRRLQALRETHDGFEIARLDLEIRGPGEFLGTRQTGLAKLRVADLVRDADLVAAARKAAGILLEQDPRLCDALIRRWLGGAERYAEV